MEFEVFKSGEVIATLTTESCRSGYGIPVLRIEGPGYGNDFGPTDVVENALAADIIFWLLRQPWKRGGFGMPIRVEATPSRMK
ncbi:MAG: hypothetical protein ABSH06_17055 [Thermodesulfobacteriota bacterium]|jgi:hypothetical protein